MGSKYEGFTDDVVCLDNESDDDRRGHVLPVNVAAAIGGDIQPPASVTVSAGTQPVILIPAPKLQRSFERYSSKAAAVFGGIQVLSR